MSQVTPLAAVKAYKTNITSADVKGSMQLESLTQSSSCFYGGGCGFGTVSESALCPIGAYVYQITGHTGSDTGSGYIYPTGFDIVCSDGYTATIGLTGSYNVSSTTIINPQGYTEVLAAGGCITGHVQIGGTDFGDAYGLSSCSCAPGLSLVGFGTLQYQTYFPSFATMTIQCDVACPKGTYYNNSNCLPCPKGINTVLNVIVISIII